MPPLPSPRPFGKFLLLERLGHGGAGVVYKAEQPDLGRVVALKFLHVHDEGDPEAVARFLHEARAAARLDHPGVVPIYEVGEHEAVHYFAMDYVDGPSLRKLADARELPPRRVAEVVRDAARTIHHAHGQGIIHRDLKPSNILLDAAGRVLVSDFGLAKDLRRAPITESGDVFGTPAYMPPEQARGDSRSVDARSDVYSLGAVLYHLLTGRPPFQAELPMQIVMGVLTAEPARPRSIDPDVPAPLEAICLKAMEKKPERRYATAAALADDLDRWLRGEAISARPETVTRRTLRRVRRRPLHVALAAAVLLLLAAGGLWLGHAASVRAELRELRARAEEAWGTGRLDEAVKLYARIATLDPADAAAAGRVDEALRRLRQR